MKSVKITPSLVQRDMNRIISTLGTVPKSPKRRGYSEGRIKGDKKVPRTRHQVIKKAHRPRRGFLGVRTEQETKKVAKEKLKAS